MVEAEGESCVAFSAPVEEPKICPVMNALLLLHFLCSAGHHCKGLNSTESPKSPWGHLFLVRITGLPGIC